MTQKTIHYTLSHSLQADVIKLCHAMELPLHDNIKGPKLYTNFQRVSLITLYYRSKKSLRDFCEEFKESLWPKWLGLKRLPKKSTLHDWLRWFSTAFVRELNDFLIADEQPQTLAIDATGIDSWQRSRHYQWRIGDSYMPYAKLDALVDTETGLIFDFCLRMKPRHDILGAKTILRRTKLRNVTILGDKGYDAEELHELAAAKGNTFFAPLRERERKRIYGKFRRKCVEKHPEYPKRNSVESAFHALKTVHISSLRSKLHYMKKREMGWHVLVYNLKRINKRIAYLFAAICELFRTYPSR